MTDDLRERALAYLRRGSDWTREDVRQRLFMAMGLYERMPVHVQDWIREEYETRKEDVRLSKEPELEI